MRNALIVPGGLGGPYTPTLMFAADAAEARGARIHPLWWSRPDDPPRLKPGHRGPWVRQDVAPALDGLEPLLIARSLGSYAAPLAADRALPAVWLNPVLHDDWVIGGLRRATAPFLLVGGTADLLWNSRLARELTPYVLEVEGANHGMYVDGPLARSAAVLGELATAVEHFLDDVVWTP